MAKMSFKLFIHPVSLTLFLGLAVGGYYQLRDTRQDLVLNIKTISESGYALAGVKIEVMDPVSRQTYTGMTGSYGRLSLDLPAFRKDAFQVKLVHKHGVQILTIGSPDQLKQENIITMPRQLNFAG